MYRAEDMCATVYSIVLLLLIFCNMALVSEGLPIYRNRQEHGTYDDLIAGEAFLSMLLGSPSSSSPLSPHTEPHPRLPPTDEDTSTVLHQDDTTTTDLLIASSSTTTTEYLPPVIRETRSSPLYNSLATRGLASGGGSRAPRIYNSATTTTLSDHPNPNSERSTNPSSEEISNTVDFSRSSKHSSEPSSATEDGMIISVRVSSSVGKSLINKHVSESKEIQEIEIIDTTTEESVSTTYDTLEIVDQTALQSEEHPTLVAEANKSEFSVDEGEPVTRNSYHQDMYNTQAHIPSVPPTSYEAIAKKLPYHQSVIYHDDPKEPTRARSVSYSTVIQSLPQQQQQQPPQPRKPWTPNPDRIHYKMNHTRHDDTPLADGSVAESKDYYVTSKYNPMIHDYQQQQDEQKKNIPPPQIWRRPDETNYQMQPETSTTPRKYYEPTERNWGIPEKNYGVQQLPQQNLPIVYGQPEQNYEVDEAVSVESNGRAHGVQPSAPVMPQNAPTAIGQQQQQDNTRTAGGAAKKDDDNQKVGYVVEGRNYRKYRVEERTSDGFIVGEYGVVSHNDGSLRGVRYTADGTISPRLIYDALMKFLSL